VLCTLRPMRRACHWFGGVQPKVSVSVSVCGLGTSTNSYPSFQFGCSTTERKYHKIYSHTL